MGIFLHNYCTFKFLCFYVLPIIAVFSGIFSCSHADSQNIQTSSLIFSLILILIIVTFKLINSLQREKFRRSHRSKNNHETKIAIVGGGVAGLFTAYLLARRYFSVTVFERSILPQDKACGEGLTKQGASILKYFEIVSSQDLADAKQISGMTFNRKNASVTALYPIDETGITMRRTLLSRKLLQQLSILPNVNVLDKTPFIFTKNVNFDFIIGADGIRSMTAKYGGFRCVSRFGFSRSGFRQHFYAPRQEKKLKIFFTDFGDLYVTPISDRVSQLTLLTDTNSAPFQNWNLFADEIPEILELIDLTRPMSKLRAHGPLSWLALNPVKSNYALIGDANCSFDACTGVGVTKAFKQSLLFSCHFPWLQHSKIGRLSYTLKVYHSVMFYLLPTYLLLFLSQSKAMQSFVIKLDRHMPKIVQIGAIWMLRLIDLPSAKHNLKLHGEIFKILD